MILIPQSVVRDCHAVFRRVAPRSSMARSATSINIVSGRDGVRLRLAQADVSVEYHHPSPAESCSLTLPMTALADCEGRGSGVVELHKTKAGVELRWEQSGAARQREYAAHEPARTPFPAWPARDTANDPSMLEALDEAMQIPTGGASGRLALNCIQLRGMQGDIVATDGRQLLIQGGFQFPWRDATLLPKTAIFASRELPKGEVVRVAKADTHVLVRVGGWTIALQVEAATRFPNVEAVIPKADRPMTCWHVGAEEASALVTMLDNLPAAKEENAPVTLDLTRPVVIRASGEEEKRCTDVALPRSSVEGKALRVATDRRFLQRALDLGFRTIQITALDKPMLCQDGQRLYVWAPLDPKHALAPQPNALRVMLPASGDRSRRTSPAAEPAKRPAPAPTGSRNPVGAFGGFFACARSLWDLVRKHHQEEQVK